MKIQTRPGFINILHIIMLLLISYSCKQNQDKEQVAHADEPIPIETVKNLPSLEEGEVFYKNKEPFGEIINLSGKQLVTDTIIFKVSEAEMLVKDNRMVIKNQGDNLFMLFETPEMKFISYSGKRGQGPDEFNYPHLVPTPDTSFLCYVFESSNQKLYRLEKTGELRPDSFTFTASKQRSYSDKAVVNLAPDDFIYAETSATGKSIFHATKTGDSIANREIFNLGLNSKLKSWTAYIGDFAVNPKQNRMVYAYKYFKIIKFMDLKAQTVRTINFEREEFDEKTTYKMDGLDQNITHYWGVSTGEDYVYFLYSGRTPFDVVKESGKKQYYIFVEQYDWNGNPVHKYKLDRWGYFTVDEKNKLIYLASTNDDDPVFVFNLPE